MRKPWRALTGAVFVGVILGCSSNPHRPTLFSRNRAASGPELGTPVPDGPMLSGDPAGYALPPGAVPGQGFPPGTPVAPAAAPPVQGFPPTVVPQGPAPVPQGPPPRPQPNTPTGRSGV